MGAVLIICWVATLLGTAAVVVLVLRRRFGSLPGAATAQMAPTARMLDEAQAMVHFGYWETDLSTMRTQWSAEMFRLLGYEPGSCEPSADRFFGHLHADDLERAMHYDRQYDRISDTPDSVLRVHTTQGAERWIRASIKYDAASDGTPVRIFGIMQDITDLKEVETGLRTSNMALRAREQELQAANQQLLAANQQLVASEMGLRESEARLRAVVDTARDAIIICDKSGRICSWNRGAQQMYGYQASEITGRPVTVFVPERYHPVHDRAIQGLQQPGEGRLLHNRRLEGIARRKDGTEFPTEVSVSAWQLDDEMYLTFIARDITDRVRTQQEVQASRDYLHTIFMTSPDAILVIDSSGTIRMASTATAQVFGLTVEQLEGRPETVLADLDPDHQELLRVMMDGLMADGKVNNFEMPWKRADGTPIWIEWNSTLQRDASGNPAGAVTVVREVSDRKRIEAQARQSQKMEAIGTLAGGIAHDFNNILAAIIGYTQMNQYVPRVPDQVQHNSACVLQAAERARDLVRQILTFSRQTDEELKQVSPRLIVEEALRMLRASIPAGIEIVRDVVSERMVIADATQLHQVVMNLCANAYHAMLPDGGTLSVRLHDLEIDASRGDLPAGRCVQLVVADTGCGIPVEIVDKIFDPFFTTKQPDVGTGMGLSVVYGIVTAWGGSVEVDSTPGAGSEFRVILPVVEALPVEAAARETELVRGSGRILFVDDEEMLADVGRRMLESLGYEVCVCGNGQDALATFRRDSRGFDLIITDCAMPRMSGETLVGAIRAIRQDMPVVMCTGFSETMTEDKARAVGARHLLSKPFNFTELATVVHTVLAG